MAVRYAVAPPDAEHRYGHGKAEAFASLLQAGLVFASAALVGQEAVRHLLRPEPVEGGWAGVEIDMAVDPTERRPCRRNWSTTRPVDSPGPATFLAPRLRLGSPRLPALTAAVSTGRIA